MKLKVTVICICYNHENYIQSTLDGIFNQVTDFDIEVIIYDDKSTDDSRGIIDNYSSNNKVKLRKIYPESNCYSKGIRPLSIVLPHVTTEFVAFCEGDDYWIDSHKLQKQYDALNRNENLKICFHPAKVLREGELISRGYGYHGNEETIIPLTNVINVSGGMMPMASIFIRTKEFLELEKKEKTFFKKYLRHSAIQILNAKPDGALYIPDEMSVYRSMHAGSWSSLESSSKKIRIINFIEFYKRNKNLDRILEYKYHKNFNQVFKERFINLLRTLIKNL